MKFHCLKKILHLPQAAHFFKQRIRCSTHFKAYHALLIKRDKRTPSWNLELCWSVWGNLAQFSKRCTFLKEHLSHTYKQSFQWMPRSQRTSLYVQRKNPFKECHDRKSIPWYIYIYIKNPILILKWCWNLLTERAILFWNSIRIEDRTLFE